MNGKLLRERLGIDQKQLTAYIAAGLPWTGSSRSKQFDESEVIAWLLENGKAEYEGTDNIVESQAAVARAMGVSEVAVHKWRKQDGFPGEPGCYPLDEIREWYESKIAARVAPKGGVSASSDDGDGLSYQDRLRKLRLEKEQEQLVSVEEVMREMQREHAYAVAELHLIVGKVESQLPSDLDGKVKTLIRDTITKSVDEAIEILREMIEGSEEDESV